MHLLPLAQNCGHPALNGYTLYKRRMADGAQQVHCTCGQILRPFACKSGKRPKVLPDLPYIADMHAQQLFANENVSVYQSRMPAGKGAVPKRFLPELFGTMPLQEACQHHGKQLHEMLCTPLAPGKSTCIMTYLASTACYEHAKQ